MSIGLWFVMGFTHFSMDLVKAALTEEVAVTVIVGAAQHRVVVAHTAPRQLLLPVRIQVYQLVAFQICDQIKRWGWSWTERSGRRPAINTDVPEATRVIDMSAAPCNMLATNEAFEGSLPSRIVSA
eukprot:m.795182 g.795182  ORF g.795182 m.795182 type:complete len:126 (-) comp23341_c0_seq26:2466-2843(-)